ncbi:hypothetical protein IP69_15340 [Bosea sp. AAP35]|uniref:hypothetical protein n=1 Tax=Bosea sp. AAP35 TaxID=1523417 RepID=UPI0006B93410|nr:hypothetical protein [Bosea sp. AAP35]KPF66244.1 hypothetical protein IP69_15340 [Bosea sp. AAP35]
MDFGNAPRTTPVGGPPIAARADIVATQGSVGVELPPEKTVQSAQAGRAIELDIRGRDLQQRAETESARNEALRRSAASSDIERRLIVEPQTRTVILQRRDASTGEVVETIPDEASLRRRVYARVLAQQEAEAARIDRSV